MASLDIRSEWHCLDCKNYLADGRMEICQSGHDLTFPVPLDNRTSTYTYVGAGTAWA
ncbi:hypothetical protein FOXYSP1_03237 [Fusarium oxysporum f. sp. phaseoli]